MFVISSRDRIVFNAVVLDEQSFNLLKGKYPGIYQNYFGHHVTLNYGINEPPDNLGEVVDVIVDGYAKDENAEAVHVSLDQVRSQNPNPHITISTNNGIKPSYSNTLLAKGYQKIPPIILKGTVASYINGKYVTEL